MNEKQLERKILDSGRTLLFSKDDLRRLIIPLVIDQILARTVGMADTMMISSVGEAAISGVSLVDMINMLITPCLPRLRPAAQSLRRSIWDIESGIRRARPPAS